MFAGSARFDTALFLFCPLDVEGVGGGSFSLVIVCLKGRKEEGKEATKSRRIDAIFKNEFCTLRVMMFTALC